MAKYYAWSVFPVDRNVAGQVTKAVQPGEEVTAEKLKISKEEFDDLVEVGAVREEEYPDVDSGTSPAEYYAQLEAGAVSGELSPEEMKALQEYKDSQVTEEEKATAEVSAGNPPKSSGSSK